MTEKIRELRSVLDFAKSVRGGPPQIIWGLTDQDVSNEKRLLISKRTLQKLSESSSFVMTKYDAYALGEVIAFLNMEIERLKSICEANAKP